MPGPPSGGASAQLPHLGLILNMSVVENATIAMAYAKAFREEASHLARQRATNVNWTQFLSEEDDVTKRNVLREMGLGASAMKAPSKAFTPQVPKTPFVPIQNGKGVRGSGKKGKGKYGKQTNNDWSGNQGWKTKPWGKNNWPNNDWSNNQTQQQQKKEDKPDASATPAEPPQEGDKKRNNISKSSHPL